MTVTELTNEAAFSAHVEEYHVSKPSNTQLLALAAAAREIRHHPANEQLCPLCLQNGWQDERKFITHVARHMEDIALSAVPRDDDTDTDDSDKLSQGSNNLYNTEIFLDDNSNQQQPASDSAALQWSPPYSLQPRNTHAATIKRFQPGPQATWDQNIQECRKQLKPIRKRSSGFSCPFFKWDPIKYGGENGCREYSRSLETVIRVCSASCFVISSNVRRYPALTTSAASRSRQAPKGASRRWS
jgi:hypothetical protein